MNRTVTEDRQQTDADRLEMFKQAQAQASLPDIPPIPGYHVVWLTTTNSKDSIQMRTRMGYVPVTPEEVKGFEFGVGQGNLSDALIRINEMAAYKLPIHLYNLYMQENHHYAPAREETKLTDTANQVKQQLASKGSHVDEGDGVEALRNMDSIAVPDFTE
jgi:hypothetical protein